MKAPTEQDIRRIAADANVDPRTVRRALAGGPKQSAVIRGAIARALRANGWRALAREVERTASR